MRGIDRLGSVERSTPAMAKALPDLPMQETVLVRLLRIGVFSMSAFFEPVFRSWNLTEHSFHVLCLLVATGRGSASPSELSELVGTTRANMTRILDELAADGMVSRTVEARDARRQAIHITPAGRKATAETASRIVEPLQRAFSGLSREEMAQLDRLLRKAIVSFDQGAVPQRAAA
jgi:MarR family transcriptional repressor of emrRAB